MVSAQCWQPIAPLSRRSIRPARETTFINQEGACNCRWVRMPETFHKILGCISKTVQGIESKSRTDSTGRVLVIAALGPL